MTCLTCGLACDDGEVCPRCGLRSDDAIPPAVLRERAELLRRERERWMEHEGPG